MDMTDPQELGIFYFIILGSEDQDFVLNFKWNATHGTGNLQDLNKLLCYPIK